MQSLLSYFRRVFRSRGLAGEKAPLKGTSAVESPVADPPVEEAPATKPVVEETPVAKAPMQEAPVAKDFGTGMAPEAMPLPVVEEKSVSRPALNRVNTANMHTKRKIICFSGT